MKQLGPSTWVIPGRTAIGYYEENGCGYLIDSGGDDEAGRKLLRVIESRGVPLRAIINTHSNADHIGGNAFLQRRTGCEVWGPPVEGMLIERPLLEPLWLWGAHPFAQICGKFIQAKPSQVTRIASSGQIRDTALEAVELPGHFLNMIGVKTPDRIFFAADALFSPEVLAKYRFCVMLDVASAFETLDRLLAFDARYIVPCHAPVAAQGEELVALVEANRRALGWINDAVLATLDEPNEPKGRDEILGQIACANGLVMDEAHFLLNLMSVSAHLTYLSGVGKIEPVMRDCRLKWSRVA